MKKLFYLFICAATVTSFTACNGGSASAEAAVKGKVDKAPRTNQLSVKNSDIGAAMALTTVSLNETTHDFGTVAEGEKPETVFKLTNNGSTDMIINRAQASCGCTTPDAPLNKPFKPGETAEIRVQYDSNKRPGPINKTVKVYGNFETNPTVLTIKGTVTPDPNKATNSVK